MSIQWLTRAKMNPESRAMLPKVAFTGFASRYREPSLKEGFEDITKVDFEVRGTVVRLLWPPFLSAFSRHTHAADYGPRYTAHAVPVVW